MKLTKKAWAIVKAGKFCRNVLPGIEGKFVLAIYATRSAARRSRCLNNGERIARVNITVT